MGRRSALVGVMAHWQDIGGMVRGSLSGTATEIFQEGVRIPPIRIARGGVLVEEVLDLLFANVREPADRRGDLNAMEGACRLGEAKLKALAARRGAAVVSEAMATLLDRAERRMRAAIAELPDGVYRCRDLPRQQRRFERAADPDWSRSRSNGDELTADFTGCPPQVPGPTNPRPGAQRRPPCSR